MPCPLRLLALLALVLAACGKREGPRDVTPDDGKADPQRPQPKGGDSEKKKAPPPDEKKKPSLPDDRVGGKAFEEWRKPIYHYPPDFKAQLVALRAAKGRSDHPRAREVADAVLYLFESKDEAVRKEALAVLPTLGAGAAGSIANSWGSVRAPSGAKLDALLAALRALGKDALPALVAAARHGKWMIAQPAADQLVVFQADAVAPLVALLGEKGWFKDKLNMPAAILARIGEPAVSAVVKAARDAKKREAALMALRRMDKGGREALATLSKDKDKALADRAAAMLASLSPPVVAGKEKKPDQPADPVPGLVEQLGEDKTVVPAIQALARLGPAAVPATEKLLAIAADGKRPVLTRAEALACLARIGPGAARALVGLRNLVRNPQAPEELRGLAAFAVGTMGPAAKGAVGDLIKLLESPGKKQRRWQRFAAILSLGRIGPDARDATPALVKAIHHRYDRDFGPWPVLAVPAMQALARIGEGAKGAASELRKFAQADAKDSKLAPWRLDALAALLAIDKDQATLDQARKLAPSAGPKFCRTVWAADAASRPAVIEQARKIIDGGEPFRGAEWMDLLAECGPEAVAAVPNVIGQYQYSGTLSTSSTDNPLSTGFGSYGDGPTLRPTRALLNELYPPRRLDMNRSLLLCLGRIGKGSPMAEAFLDHLAWFSLNAEHRRLAADSLRRIAPPKAKALPRE